MTRYVAYFRVSTEKQGKSGLGLAAQHSLIERFLSDGDEVVAEYVEVQSGIITLLTWFPLLVYIGLGIILPKLPSKDVLIG